MGKTLDAKSVLMVIFFPVGIIWGLYETWRKLRS